ncbi:hypothetical protein CDN99_03040 [Roseateles aquatilis]|uniref:Uncharacterized protein n=2 Tax=Roseateles aquatilis TaxID=431061 RepID=A0A246JLT1_9BURK|nr:hypothetical protein CDN99_03040 [Roseateles aquatilis]
MTWVLAAAIAPPAHAQLPVAIESPPKADAAMRMVYGGTTWRDERIAAFFGGRSPALRAEIREVFRARYVERDVDKLMLVYQLTPGPRDQFRCAACVPALGAAVLAADEAGRWKLRARGLLLTQGMPGSGDEDLQLLQIADDRWILRSRRHDDDRGRESRRERLILERDGEVQLAADLGFEDKPGPRACGAGAAPQTSGVSVLSPGLGPRVEVVLRFNEGTCPSPRPVVQRTRMELRDGRFQLAPDPDADDEPGAASAPGR